MEWVEHLRMYGCRRCGKRSKALAGPKAPCSYGASVMSAKVQTAADCGHTPWMAQVAGEDAGSVLFCKRCGLYADGCARGTQRECKGGARPHWALRRIMRGAHPTKGVALHGIGPCRTEARAVTGALRMGIG